MLRCTSHQELKRNMVVYHVNRHELVNPLDIKQAYRIQMTSRLENLPGYQDGSNKFSQT